LPGLLVADGGGLTTGFPVFAVVSGAIPGFAVGVAVTIALGALLGSGLAVSVGAAVGVAVIATVGAAVSAPPGAADPVFGLPIARIATEPITLRSVRTPITPRIIGVFDRGALAVEAFPHEAPVADGLPGSAGCAPEACAQPGPLGWIVGVCTGGSGATGGLPGQLALCAGGCGRNTCGSIAGSGGIWERSSTCVAGGWALGATKGCGGRLLMRAE